MEDLESKVEECRKENRELGIIGITESWGDKDHAFNLQDYTAYRNDRADGYGGAILYVKKSIEQRVC